MIWLIGFGIVCLIVIGCLLNAWRTHDDDWLFNALGWLVVGNLCWAVIGTLACMGAQETTQGHEQVQWQETIKPVALPNDDSPSFIHDDGGYFSFYARTHGGGYHLDSIDAYNTDIIESSDPPRVVAYEEVRHSAWWPWAFHDEETRYELIVPPGTMVHSKK